MPSLVFPNAVEVRLHWTMNGVDTFNVLHATVSGGFVNGQVGANALDAAVKGSLASSGLEALLASTTSLRAVGIRDLRTANQAEFVGGGAAVAGTGVGNPLPNEVALCITIRTAMAGKSFRGRVYLGGFIVTQNTASGQIAPACNTAAAAFILAMAGNFGDAQMTMSVLSHPRPAGPNNVPPAWPGALTPITAAIARDTLWDSQRSRKR